MTVDDVRLRHAHMMAGYLRFVEGIQTRELRAGAGPRAVAGALDEPEAMLEGTGPGTDVATLVCEFVRGSRLAHVALALYNTGTVASDDTILTVALK